MITLDMVIRDTRWLAPLSPAASRLVRIAQDCDADVNEVVTIVRYDPVLASHLLAHANAGHSPGRTPLTRVRDAVMRLGVLKVLEIAITEHLGGAMTEAIPAYGFQERDLWEHAAAAALAAEALQRAAAAAIPPAAILAALLHDVGKLALAPYLEPEDVAAIARATEEQGLVHSQAELDVCGLTHAQVGARVAEIWNLDDQIRTAIRRHHEIDTDHGPVSDAVRVSNLIAKSIGCGLGDEGLNLAADAGAASRLRISRQDFELACAEVTARLGEIEQIRPRAA